MNTALVFLVGLVVTAAIGFGTYVNGLRRADPGTFTFTPFIRGGFIPVAWVVGFILVLQSGIIGSIAKQVGGVIH